MYKKGCKGKKGFLKRHGNMRDVNGVEPKSTIDNESRSQITREVRDPAIMGEKIRVGYERTIRGK